MAIVSITGSESERVDRPRNGSGHYWMQLQKLCSDPTKRTATGVPGLYWPGICMLVMYEDLRFTIPAIAQCMGHHKGHVSRVIRSTRAKLRAITTNDNGILDAVEQLANAHTTEKPYARLTDREWRLIEPLLADYSFKSMTTRDLIDEIIRKHSTGIPWRALPRESTKRRAYDLLRDGGAWHAIMARLGLEDLGAA